MKQVKQRVLLFLALATVALAQVGNWGITGQQSVTGSAVAVALPQSLVTACVKGLPGNTSPALVYVGSSSAVTTSTGYPLGAGESICVPIRNGAQIYVIASTTGSGVAWFGTYQ